MRARPMTLALALAATLTMVANTDGQSQAPTKAEIERHLSNWKAKPKELAQKLVQKYGTPDEVTANRLIWHNKGPWKFTELVNEEIPHEFPMPHTDMLYQAIDYRIDPSKADEILAYDGSVILERTKGEIGARCDKEEPNFLAINLAHEVATGKRSVDEARKFYAESMMRLMKEGKPTEYHQGFRFTVSKGNTGDPDKPVGGMKSSQ